ncbi:MAG: Rrf2 family transcriptional regulator [Clostridia bacterium]|nr:Rrf2 family transcriptional regulator [Clostridia bacterium]
MMISTKGRYALRILLDIASAGADAEYISLGDVANRQEISMKYLEAIVASLSKAGLVESKRGKSGGYRLSKTPAECTVADVVKAAEGGISPVACPECDGQSCSRSAGCLTVDLWKQLDGMIERYLSAVTLADLLNGKDLSAVFRES